jgi:flagellar biosynthesis protein FlhF
MLMKKFTGATSREAMKKMKADLGPEAYVISNRKTSAGVEIMAMTDADAEQATAPASRPSSGMRAASSMREPIFGRPAIAPIGAIPLRTLRDIAVHLPSVEQPRLQPAPAAPARAAPAVAAPTAALPGASKPAGLGSEPPVDMHNKPVARPVQGPNEERVLGELRAMKSLFESRLAGLEWRGAVQRRPLATQLWRELTDAGYSPALARTLVARLPDDFSEARAREWLSGVLARNLRCVAAPDELIARGGVYALTGPTGSGKTTTTAKLAARCVVRHGVNALGLITTDAYRIGAFDQLSIYGKILGVPVHMAQSATELAATLAAMKAKHLVLIDTAGMGQRDARLAEQAGMLALPPVRRLLLLNASTQAETLDDVVRVYGAAHSEPGQNPAGVAPARPPAQSGIAVAGTILTKLDEAVKLGPVLDVCARHALRVHYVTGGQRVPEDLHLAQVDALVHRSLRPQAASVFALHDDEVPLRAAASVNVASAGAVR